MATHRSQLVALFVAYAVIVSTFALTSSHPIARHLESSGHSEDLAPIVFRSPTLSPEAELWAQQMLAAERKLQEARTHRGREDYEQRKHLLREVIREFGDLDPAIEAALELDGIKWEEAHESPVRY